MSSLYATVVVPSRGGRKHLPLLLESFDRQDTDDFEVIVVLDGDIDASEQYLLSMQDRLNFTLKVIVFPENQGRVSALNTGTQAASGNIIIRCDDDLVPSPNYVSAHLSHHQDQPCGVIGIYRNIYPETSYARIYGRETDIKFRDEALRVHELDRWLYWAGNVSIPRSIHLQLGGYDPRYRTYGWEDVDFGFRLKLNDIPIVIATELTTDHRVAATTTAVRALRALHSGAARDTFLQIHGHDALTNGRPDGLWGLLVKGCSLTLNEKSIRFLGNSIDAITPAIPRYFSKKMIALLVESSSYSGINDPERAKSIF